MNCAQIQQLQIRVGTTPDGFWGPKSIAACQAHLRSLMPSQNPWPHTDEASLRAFYGRPGDEDLLTDLPVADLGIRYEGLPVRTIRCHQRVAASLGRVLTQLHMKGFHHILEHYDGCYDNRPMRNGTIPSLHARGAAIDLDSKSNDNLQSWPASADMPIEVMEIFAAEGATCAGSAWGRDGMHFQWTA